MPVELKALTTNYQVAQRLKRVFGSEIEGFDKGDRYTDALGFGFIR